MDQTPAHERHNPDLLGIIPAHAGVIVEVGCSSGALAREAKKSRPACRYVGVEVMPQYVTLAKRHCDLVVEADIEDVDEETMRQWGADCWVFGDALEHLRDPWALLARLRRVMPAHGCIVACIPNAQNWTVQVRLNSGTFRYEDQGLMDRSHLRWFTRVTMCEMFAKAGFRIEAGFPRGDTEPPNDGIKNAIRLMAQSMGVDPDLAYSDCVPIQFVVRAIPA
jgi:SAM-dependent methyltransferase